MKRLMLSGLVSLMSLPLFSQFPCCDLPFDLYASIEGGYYWFDVPKFTYGALVTGTGGEIFFPDWVADDCVDEPYGIVHGGLKMHPSNGCFSFLSIEAFGFFSGEERINRNFSSSDDGLPIINLIDGGGTYGSLFPQSGFLNREYNYCGGGAFFKGTISSKCLSLTPYFAYAYYKLDETYDLLLNTALSGTGNFSSTSLKECLETAYNDFGVGLELATLFCCHWILKGYGAIYYSHASTDFKGKQVVQLNPSGILTARVENCTKHDTCKLKGGLELGYMFNCFCNLTLSVVGNIEHWGYIPEIKNPIFAPGVAMVSGQTTTFGSLGGKIGIAF